MYYPILKKGNSEIRALEMIISDSSDSIHKFLPIIEAPQKSDPKKWEADFKTFGTYLKRKIPNVPFAFQFTTAFTNSSINNEELWESTSGLNFVEYVHDILHKDCPNYIPCFNYDDPDWVLESVPNETFEKMIVRIEPYKYESGLDSLIIPGIKSRFKDAFNNKEIIWLLDFYKSFTNLERIRKTISLLDSENSGNNVVFGATSCPEDAQTINKNEFSIASTRNDLSSYHSLKEYFPNLSFADYTVRLKPDPSAKQKTDININNTYFKFFYTTKTNYMIAKSGLIGKQDSKPLEHISVQKTCDLIISSPHYKGKDYSWGDKKIFECATGKFQINGHQSPISIGINHHIISTLDYL